MWGYGPPGNFEIFTLGIAIFSLFPVSIWTQSTIEPMTIFTIFMFKNRSLPQNLNGLNQIVSAIFNLPLNLA